MKSKIQILIALAVMLVMLSAVEAQAQAPQLFNYQGIARDAKGNPLSNQTMTLKLSVLPTSDASDFEYEEIQTVKTNEFGLYSLQIGNGSSTSARKMKDVKWETGNKYIKVGIDPKGGQQFEDAGTNQLLSVPYAIYADKSGVATKTETDKTRTGAVNSNAAHVAGDANYVSKFTAFNEIGKSLLYDNGSAIGIGTTTPSARFHINQNVAAVQEHIRMQNISPTGAGRFTMYNDGASSYATFTKYGSGYAGGYAGIVSLYPLANLLAFGNNGVAANDGLGRFLISSGGNIGISIAKSGTSKLKFHADFSTENVGIGGSAIPANRVHLNNTDGADMTVGVSNNTSGHLATDGLVIRANGNAASIINMENSTLELGTNNTPRLTITAAGNTELTGQIKIAGGAPGAGKVLTSDANGLATWATAAGGGNISGTGVANNVARYISPTVIGSGALTDDGNNVGINATAHAPLQFANVVANRKAVLYEVANNDHQFFGLGINSGLMRYQVGDVVNNHVFYAGATAATSNELMRIQGNGNVGIGTATPTSKLEVAGQIKITGGTPGAGKVLTSDAAGLATWSTPAAGGITGSGTTNFIPRFASATGLTNSSITESITGSIGINAAPNAVSSITIADINLGSQGGALFLGNGGHGIQRGFPTYSSNNNVGVFTTGADVFLSTSGLATGQFVVKNGGNVGIGTSTPGTKLEVAGQIKITGGTPGAGKILTSDATGLAVWSAPLLPSGVTAGNTSYWNGTNWAVSSNIFNNGGNVGIGTTTPGTKLEVAGQIKITGGAPGAGKVLTSDAIGVATWTTIGGVAVGTTNKIPKYTNTSTLGDGSLYDNGGIGIGVAAPHAPLHFTNGITNRKIILYENVNNDHNFYGFGVNAGIFRYQISTQNDAHVFYAGTNGGASVELMRIQGNGNVGIGTAAPSQKFHVFNGTSNGTYTTTGWVHSSDKRLKTNITPLQNSLDKITHLTGVSYNWKNAPNSNSQVGFIAQDVEKVFPEVVVVDSDGNYGMAYQNLVAPMVEAIKELNQKNELQQKQIEKQQRINADLLKRLEALENK